MYQHPGGLGVKVNGPYMSWCGRVDFWGMSILERSINAARYPGVPGMIPALVDDPLVKTRETDL